MNITAKLNTAYAVSGIGLFVYIVLRAIFVPPYADEIGTFLMYIQTGSFQPFYSVLEANNHVINSLFSHLFFRLLGDSLFVLRLANVLSFALYLFYVWKIQKMFSVKFIGFCSSLVLIFTPYLLEFFSLARGYGMSMAFLTGAIYYLLSYNAESKSKFLWGGVFMTSLALWSNLSLMVTVIIIGSIFLILFFKESLRQRMTKDIIINSAVIICLFIIPFYYAVKFSLLLKNSGHLYHGSDSFINGVILNLVTEFSESYRYGDKIFYLLFAVYVIAGIYALVFKPANRSFLFIQMLFWGSIAGTILLHFLTGVNYPQNRAALHFYVLFVLALFFALDRIEFKIKFFFPSIVALIFLVQFIKTANLNYAPVWKDETVPVSFYDYLLRWQNQNGTMPIVSAHGLLGKVVGYYDYHNGTKINTVEEEDFPRKTADFIITNSWNTEDLSAEYDTVLMSRETNIALMKRKVLIQWEPVQIISRDSSSGPDEFFPCLEIPANLFDGAPFCCDILFKAQSDRFPFICFLATELRDSTNNVISSRSIDLQRVKPDIRKKVEIHRKQCFDIVPKNAKILKVFFWNLKKRTVNLSDVKITLLKGKLPGAINTVTELQNDGKKE